MNHERRMMILEAWKTEVINLWRPHLHGSRYQFILGKELPTLDLTPSEHMEVQHDVLVFTADHLGRVYCEGLYIGIFPKPRARA